MGCYISNITDAPDSCFIYDTNNRLIVFNGNTVSYDMDGNMLSNGYINCEFDSGNRLLKAGINEYVYNAEDVRIKNLCQGDVTTYTYNTNCKLSQLLIKTTNGITTKYVYGLGLIGEEKEGCFKTYHFDYRGSTVAITDINGNITDTLKYDAYGNVTEHIGSSFIILGYNGRDGVVTDRNGLLYMRARYYSPEMRRFVNADILHGEISDSTSLNRYSYVNGNPVSFVDPFGLSKENKDCSNESESISSEEWSRFVTLISHNILLRAQFLINLIRNSLSIGYTLFSYESLKTYIEKTIVDTFTVEYDVPLYNQGYYNLCWAFCQTMVESYESNNKLTYSEATRRAIDIAMETHGSTDEEIWNKGGYPTDAKRENNTVGGPVEQINIYSLFHLFYLTKKQGPLYAYYWNGKVENGNAHLVVVTGVDLLNGTVSTNNPWGISGKQSYQEFREGFLGEPERYRDIEFYYIIPRE